MYFKPIVFFAFVAVTVAERPQVGLRIPRILPPFIRSYSPQVVGGEEAPEGSYPYIVSLQVYNGHFCAGSILNERWVVTAGHCIDMVPIGDITVKAGKHNIKVREDTEQVVHVTQIIVHKNYKGGVGPYDIGLLELASLLKFNDRIKPIKLAAQESDPISNKKGLLAGWSSTSTSRAFPEYPDKLQNVEVVYVDRATCHEAVLRLTGSSPVHETNVCSGPLTGEISTCYGDSGPLISVRLGEEPELTGIVSWSIIPCGTKGAPSVYTRVSVFIDWINQKTANN
ncbi:trypsin-1-like [Monomorium pharaonis]|uniref:trypsin-1-like n=1 Tax=Monomorium pharaonis TaxID=307658 RepID=UPI00102E1DE9|nr:trypsin-1-like [Monomorium pharaonis]